MVLSFTGFSWDGGGGEGELPRRRLFTGWTLWLICSKCGGFSCAWGDEGAIICIGIQDLWKGLVESVRGCGKRWSGGEEREGVVGRFGGGDVCVRFLLMSNFRGEGGLVFCAFRCAGRRALGGREEKGGKRGKGRGRCDDVL